MSYTTTKPTAWLPSLYLYLVEATHGAPVRPLPGRRASQDPEEHAAIVLCHVTAAHGVMAATARLYL